MPRQSAPGGLPPPGAEVKQDPFADLNHPPPKSLRTPSPEAGKRTWGVYAHQAKKAMEAALAGSSPEEWKSKLPPRPPARNASAIAKSIEEAREDAARIAGLARDLRKTADESKERLKQPQFQVSKRRGVTPEIRATFEKAVEKADKHASKVELEAAKAKRRVERYQREAERAEREAKERRRQIAAGKKILELEQAARDGELSKWEVRKRTAELLGRTGGQVTGKYKPGELTLTFMKKLEAALHKQSKARMEGATKEEAWTDELEAMRQVLWDRGLDTPEAMAEWFDMEGLSKHEGYVMFHRY